VFHLDDGKSRKEKAPEKYMNTMFQLPLAKRGGGFIGDMIRWFIMVAIYDICIGTIASVLGVSRLVACFIFLGILIAISFGGYILRQRMSPPADQ
jgi:hypothetical protein